MPSGKVSSEGPERFHKSQNKQSGDEKFIRGSKNTRTSADVSQLRLPWCDQPDHNAVSENIKK